MVRLTVCLVWLIVMSVQAFSQGGYLSAPTHNFVPPITVGSVINDGDSLFQINGSSSQVTIASYLWTASPPPNAPYSVTAVGGTTSTYSVANFSKNVTPVYSAATATYGVGTPVTIVLLTGGNDIRGSATAASVFANYQSYVNEVHALGANAKMLISTYPLQCDIFNNSAERAVLQQLNDLIYANWNVSQGSGGLGADGLVDFFGNTTVGMNTYASSAFCNATYSTDGMHGTDLTKSILGPVEGGAVTPFLSH